MFGVSRLGSRLRGIAIIARRNIRIMIMPSAVLMVVMLLMTMMMVAVVVVMNLFVAVMKMVILCYDSRLRPGVLILLILSDRGPRAKAFSPW